MITLVTGEAGAENQPLRGCADRIRRWRQDLYSYMYPFDEESKKACGTPQAYACGKEIYNDRVLHRALKTCGAKRRLRTSGMLVQPDSQ